MKPYELTMSDEVPASEIPDVPHWSENYAFYGYDYRNRTGFAAYIGRWGQDTRLWREQLYLMTPEGDLLVHRAIGRGDCSRGPNGGLLSLTCEAPGRRWRLAFCGPARPATLAELMHEPVHEGLTRKVHVDLTIDSAAPVLMFATSENSTYGRWHYEQAGECRGSFHFDDRSYVIDGHGYRDHTRGPRQLSALEGHMWLQGRFPDGLRFSAYHVWQRQGNDVSQVLNEAVIIRPGGFDHAEVLTSERLQSANDALREVSFTLRSGDGDFIMKGSPLATVPMSFTPSFEFFYGCTPSLAPFVTFDQPILLDCGGQEVRAYLQRSLRHPH